MRKARLLKTLKEPEGEQYKVTFQRELQDWIYPGRRRGAPKHTWGRTALEALWEEARIGNPSWRGVELVGTKFDNRSRQDVRDRLKEYAEEEYNRIEKERGKKGEWQEGWGLNQEMEPVKCETMVEHRRRNARIEEASSSSRGPCRRWISGGYLRSTTRGVDRTVDSG